MELIEHNRQKRGSKIQFGSKFLSNHDTKTTLNIQYRQLMLCYIAFVVFYTFVFISLLRIRIPATYIFFTYCLRFNFLRCFLCVFCVVFSFPIVMRKSVFCSCNLITLRQSSERTGDSASFGAVTAWQIS